MLHKHDKFLYCHHCPNWSTWPTWPTFSFVCRQTCRAKCWNLRRKDSTTECATSFNCLQSWFCLLWRAAQGKDKTNYINYCTTTSQTNKQAIKHTHTHRHTNKYKHTSKLSIGPNTITTSPSLTHHDSFARKQCYGEWGLISFQQAIMLCQPSCSRMCMVMTLISGTDMLTNSHKTNTKQKLGPKSKLFKCFKFLVNLDTGMNGPMKLRPHRMAKEGSMRRTPWNLKG